MTVDDIIIIIIQAMAPQSVMFPGLHPAAMMATVNFNITIIIINTIVLLSHVVTFWKRILTGWPWLPPPSWGPFKLSSARPWWPSRLSRFIRGPWSALKTPRPTSTSGEDLTIQPNLGCTGLISNQSMNVCFIKSKETRKWMFNDQETSYLYIPNAAVGAIIGKMKIQQVRLIVVLTHLPSFSS